MVGGRCPYRPDSRPAGKAKRGVFLGDGWSDVLVWDRDAIRPDDFIKGPAVIEEMSSTTVLAPTHALRVDAYGNLIVRVA